MSYQTFINADTLRAALDQLNVVIVDCRFDLADTDLGRKLYSESHIPGAVYAHVDDDLSGPPATDFGRHPLPTPAKMRALFGRIGIANTTQVFVYDNMSGVYAGRLWWMVRYMGHDAVAILDGGWDAWQRAGYPTRSGVEINTQAPCSQVRRAPIGLSSSTRPPPNRCSSIRETQNDFAAKRQDLIRKQDTFPARLITLSRTIGTKRCNCCPLRRCAHSLLNCLDQQHQKMPRSTVGQASARASILRRLIHAGFARAKAVQRIMERMESHGSAD